MPKRTVTVTHIYVHEERKPTKRKDVSNFDGKGSDLLALLRAFIAGLKPEVLVDDEKERYLSTINMEPSGRMLLVEMEMGWFGVDGKVRNKDTHELEHEHGSKSATTSDIRFLVTAPAGAPGMLVFVERVGINAAAPHVIPLFHRAFKAKWGTVDKLIMKVETLVETEAWLDRAQLEKVSGVVTAYDWGHDVADGGKPQAVGRLTTTLEPAGKQQYLPKFIWDQLRDDKMSASALLGLPDDVEVDQVQVKVSADDRSKTFVIDNEKQPSLAYLLANKGRPDDTAFKDFCLKLAADLYPNVSGEWKTADSTGTWTDEMLDVELTLPSDDDSK